MSCLFNSLSYFINIKNNLEAADSRSTAEQRATKWSTPPSEEQAESSGYCIGNQERVEVCDRFSGAVGDREAAASERGDADQFTRVDLGEAGRRAVDGNIMRSIICDYLEKDPIIFDDMNVSKIIDPEQINGYVENMRNENTYGGALEIKSFCKIFNLNVLIKSLPNNRDIEFLENKDHCYIGLYWTGDHFEPIVC